MSEPGCPQCDGVGQVPVAGDGRVLVRCPTCEGTEVEEHEEDPDFAVEVLRAALAERNVVLADGPYLDMLDNVKVRFTPEGAVYLAGLLTADGHVVVTPSTDDRSS